MGQVIYNEGKFAELILYISSQSVGDPYFGGTKLNKILYYSDFLSYGRFGEAITGAEYQHLAQGPAPRKLLPVRNRLIEEGALKIEPVDSGFGFTQLRPVALRAPRLEEFSAKQIELTNDVIKALEGQNATSVSNLSHLDFGWKATADREIIDYGTIFISSDEPNEIDEQRAAELEKEFGAVA